MHTSGRQNHKTDLVFQRSFLAILFVFVMTQSFGAITTAILPLSLIDANENIAETVEQQSDPGSESHHLSCESHSDCGYASLCIDAICRCSFGHVLDEIEPRNCERLVCRESSDCREIIDRNSICDQAEPDDPKQPKQQSSQRRQKQCVCDRGFAVDAKSQRCIRISPNTNLNTTSGANNIALMQNNDKNNPDDNDVDHQPPSVRDNNIIVVTSTILSLSPISVDDAGKMQNRRTQNVTTGKSGRTTENVIYNFQFTIAATPEDLAGTRLNDEANDGKVKRARPSIGAAITVVSSIALIVVLIACIVVVTVIFINWLYTRKQQFV